MYRLATNINWTKMKIVYLTEEKIIGSCRKIEDLRKKRNQVRCKMRSKNLVTKFRMKKNGNEEIWRRELCVKSRIENIGTKSVRIYE